MIFLVCVSIRSLIGNIDSFTGRPYTLFTLHIKPTMTCITLSAWCIFIVCQCMLMRFETSIIKLAGSDVGRGTTVLWVMYRIDPCNGPQLPMCLLSGGIRMSACCGAGKVQTASTKWVTGNNLLCKGSEDRLWGELLRLMWSKRKGWWIQKDRSGERSWEIISISIVY